MARKLDIARLREEADKAAERNESVWWVRFRAPAARFFCDEGKLHVSSIVRVLYADRMAFSIERTDRDGVSCVTCDPAIEVLAAQESMMAGLMEVVRANGLHGAYRKAGTEKAFEF